MNSLKFMGRITRIGQLEQGFNPETGKVWKSIEFEMMDHDVDIRPQSVVLRAKNEYVQTILSNLHPDAAGNYPGVWRASLDMHARTFLRKDGSGQGVVNDIVCWQLFNVEGGI